MSNPFHIRDATSADAPTIVEFNRLIAIETEHKVLDLPTLERGVADALARPDYCRYFVAEAEGKLVGQTMITYEWSDWRHGMFWWIQSVYVIAPWRRRGVFRALHEHIEYLARMTPGVCGLRLYVEANNAIAQSTYSRMGMQPSGHLLYERDWSGATREAK